MVRDSQSSMLPRHGIQEGIRTYKEKAWTQISKSAASKGSQGITVPPGHKGQPLPLLTIFDCDPC